MARYVNDVFDWLFDEKWKVDGSLKRKIRMSEEIKKAKRGPTVDNDETGAKVTVYNTNA